MPAVVLDNAFTAQGLYGRAFISGGNLVSHSKQLESQPVAIVDILVSRFSHLWSRYASFMFFVSFLAC